MEIFLRIYEWSRFAETDFFKTSGKMTWEKTFDLK